MASEYDTTRTEILRNITAQKAIYKYRVFMYSLNKDIRQHCFRITKDFLNNELNNPLITATEREKLVLLVNHWQWIDFDNNAINWWAILSNYRSLTLMTVINMWTDDISFDAEVFETSTDGLR